MICPFCEEEYEGDHNCDSDDGSHLDSSDEDEGENGSSSGDDEHVIVQSSFQFPDSPRAGLAEIGTTGGSSRSSGVQGHLSETPSSSVPSAGEIRCFP